MVRKPDTSFLRTYPCQPHEIIEGKICPYAFETASKATMTEYIQKLRNKKKIKSLLDAVMRQLFETPTQKTISTTTERTPTNALLIEKKQKDKTIKMNVIPHYNFKSWGKNIPQDQLLIIYGKVYIEFKNIEYKNSDGTICLQTYMHFKDILTQRFITSCIKPRNMRIPSGNYYVAILGRCYAKEAKGHTYYNLRVNFPVEESILLKPFSP